ncbi:GntR family transcriptional regulator [Brevibacillus ginsengisoli]|uniref:GntR family transcriptional regulator n=1 Tax=Brevibacillus ginsengisoli TaxID=363854 RepID=UPI003CE68DD6
MRKTETNSMEDFVYHQIKLAILNRKIPLKTQLGEEQLAEAFQVSRTPIRSALKRLQYEKMVQILPNKGAVINQPTPKEIEEVFHLRTILEVESVKLACRKATEEQLKQLEALTLLEEELYKNGEYGRAIEVTSEFHQGLIRLSGNELIENYSQELINITNIHLAYHDSAEKESPLCPSEHRSIIKAIRQKDEEEAVRKFLDHFTTVRKHLESNKEMKAIDFTEVFKPFSKKTKGKES